MKGGRKNLKRAVQDESLSLQDGQSLMQVISLRGSNLIEVMNSQGEKSLALFPAKFQKSMWMKRGSFVVVDSSGMEKALESGSKIGSVVSQVLFHDLVRRLQKTPEWPEVFKSPIPDSSDENPIVVQSQQGEIGSALGTDDDDDGDDNSSDEDDGLPPLEANMNRIRPAELHSAMDSVDEYFPDSSDENPIVVQSQQGEIGSALGTDDDDGDNNSSDEDDGLPPLEANMNGQAELHSAMDSDSDL